LASPIRFIFYVHTVSGSDYPTFAAYFIGISGFYYFLLSIFIHKPELRTTVWIANQWQRTKKSSHWRGFHFFRLMSAISTTEAPSFSIPLAAHTEATNIPLGAINIDEQNYSYQSELPIDWEHQLISGYRLFQRVRYVSTYQLLIVRSAL
jgi:hypothetical protein